MVRAAIPGSVMVVRKAERMRQGTQVQPTVAAAVEPTAQTIRTVRVGAGLQESSTRLSSLGS